LDQSASSRGVFLKRAAESVSGGCRLQQRVIGEIVTAVEDVCGGDAADVLRRDGLESLHLAVPVQSFGPIRDRVVERLRTDLLTMAATIGQSVMAWNEEFYIDDYLILRINFPYAFARKSDPSGENPGIGRVSPAVREIAAQRRVKDPTYDPKSYHQNYPPAAWAHGPHLDSWSGHSRDGLNIWWAICDVPPEAGMVLYPEMNGKPLPSDPKTLYLAKGYQLPKPTFIPLSAGEMLIFDPEILHGTHLNVTDRTRVAVSMRLNSAKPKFDPGCFYAREFWRRSTDVLAGNFESIVHLKREDNLGHALTENFRKPDRHNVMEFRSGQTTFVKNALFDRADRVVIEGKDAKILLVRHGGEIHAVEAQCPHYGVDLVDGGCDGTRIYCPACAVGFDLTTGASQCAELSLAVYDVRESGGDIVIGRLPKN
jgi:nitrite reductase/ring-hydroxylating ferredoxin subunit